MKYVLGLAFAAALAFPATAAEYKTFVIANQPGEYGIDQCLSTGARCGTLVADAYCQSRDFAKAKSFRPADPAEVTSSITPVSASGSSAQLIAIECQR